MNIKAHTYLKAFLVFLCIDLLWLGVVAQPLYQHYLGDFLAKEPNWYAAIIFYMLFVCGLMYFAITPALKQMSTQLAATNGALFGFFTYMTYELTNFAVIEDWPFGIVLIDIAWGTILGAIVAYVTVSISSKRGKK